MSPRPCPCDGCARGVECRAPADVFGRQLAAWEALKAGYPQLHRHELAHAEEGPRAGADGWVHARR